MNKGLILKGIGGYYTVLYNGNRQCILRARGKFRHIDKTPLPGDWVSFQEPPRGSDGVMGALLPRKNLLLRPRVANVDLLCAVVSASVPSPDYLLLDKMCASANLSQIQTVCLLNKADQTPKVQLNTFKKEYAAFSPLCVSALTGEGFSELMPLFEGKVVCLAGQSGVGKSSLLNRLLPHREFETDTLSVHGNRGKHTTRHAELVPLTSGGLLVDTPGFSLMEMPLIEPERLRTLYPEFLPFEDKCRFIGCLHDKEPDCAIKEAVETGGVPKARHARYVELLEDVQMRWRNRYE